MAEKAVKPWPKEQIGESATLFMRIHKSMIDEGIPIPGAFRNHGDGMSTDWEKYSTPKETQNRGKVPSDNGIIKMNVGDIRKIPFQSVEHTPVLGNRAHTDVFGEKNKDPEVRLKFSRIWKWAIKFSS